MPQPSSTTSATDGSGSRRFIGARGAAATIAANSAGSRLAPPTSAPSTSGRPSSSAALAAFTLPP